MISHNEAQELHRLIGGALQSAEDNQWELIGADDLTRALELAALIVADTEPSPVSYAPCITGRVEIGDAVSEFMLPLDPESSTSYSQWGADNTILWPRTDLMEALADAAREWYIDNHEEEDSDE